MSTILHDLSDLGEYFADVAYQTPGCLSVTVATSQGDPLIIWESEEGTAVYQGVPIDGDDGRGWLSDGDPGIWPLSVLHPISGAFDPEPVSGGGPDFHAEHSSWKARHPQSTDSEPAS